ncbi:hypothetical protein MASR2M78_16170 [Treponema sp.]
MARKRAKILETRYFGLIIGLLVVLAFTAIDLSTNIFNNLNTKAVDINFVLKSLVTSTSIQEGVSVTARNPKISEDLIIVGIDSRSLYRFGKWPFPRSIHANLVDSFSRIQDQAERESALFIDVFFIEADPNPADDARLVRSIKDSDRVFLETVLDVGVSDYDSQQRMLERQAVLNKHLSPFASVSGPWREMLEYKGVQAPLKPYAEQVKGFGHANYTQDIDEIYRRQALVTKLSVEVEQLRLDSLQPGFGLDDAKFERLAWTDKKGRSHSIKTPLTKNSIDALKKTVETQAPPVIIDLNGDGEAEDTYYVVRKYQDTFIPSITLSLALNYFGVSQDTVSVELGKQILIPNPTKFDPATGLRKPYSIPVKAAEFDAEGNLIKEATQRTLTEISIPISKNGEMRINYMGNRSSTAVDGYQTYPVRSYSGYADRVSGPDPETWPRTKAVGGKILMVGPFADGIAQDEKPTPYGLMYGIEIHTNALNTILMDNFIKEVPAWLDFLVLLVAVLGISYLCSRRSALLSIIVVFIGIIAGFIGISFIFEFFNLVVDFPKPSIGMLFAFAAIISYRAMTEESDKKMIRATFGKYVSPKVVDQILENPPELGGVDKELTVLFSDIRGFTTLSENMSPQELVNHLNLYLTAMTDLILDYGGTLDKYVGDEIMCFWGAPISQQDHAIRACRSALRQMEKLHELNEHWPESRRINIGIGLNSGIMTVGNMGSPGRMNYTLMGDNVNLGARLEGTNKQYGTNIIVSEFTYGLVKDYFIFRELDNIRVKGKNKPVLIYELIDSIEPFTAPELETGSKKKAGK